MKKLTILTLLGSIAATGVAWYHLTPTAQEAEQCTVVDVNADSITWRYDDTRKAFHYRGNANEAAQDWVFLPANEITDTTYLYEFSMDSWVTPYKFSIAMARDFAKFEVYGGREANVAAMTTQLIATTTVTTDSTATVTSKGLIYPHGAGKYVVGIKVVSDKNKKFFNVNNFNFKKTDISVHGPAGVDSLTAKGAELGELKAEVRFRMPAKDVMGNALSGTIKAKIASAVEEKTVEGQPGELQVVEIKSVQSTTENTGCITVTPSIGSYSGMPTDISPWVGVDLPGAAENVMIIPDSTNMGGKIVYSRPTIGQNGGYVAPEGNNYYLYQKGSLLWTRVKLIGRDVMECPFNVVAGSAQGILNLGVGAENAAGFSSKITGYQEAIGIPWSLPAKEVYTSTKGGSYTQIITSYTGATTTFAYKNPSAVNAVYAADSVPFAYTAVSKGVGEACVKLPKFSTQGSHSAVFVPNFYLGGCGNIKIKALSHDVAAVEIFNLATSGITSTGYTDIIIPLPAALQNKSWVQMIIYPEFTDEKKDFIMAGYSLYNNVVADMALSGIVAPGKVTKGDEFLVEVSCANLGRKDAQRCNVNLYSDNELISTQTIDGLATDSVCKVNFRMEMPVMGVDTLKYYAKIDYPGDEEPLNNASQPIKVVAKESVLPMPMKLRATSDVDKKAIALSWDAPDVNTANPVKITEDFEDANSFAASYGDWQFVDADKSAVGGFQGITIPGITAGTTTGSYWVWDQQQLGNSTFQAHSGSKYLFSMLRWDNGQSDDWVISPRLPAIAQEISFYAKSYVASSTESIEVWYSKSSSDISNFIQLTPAAVAVPSAWTQMQYALPEGTTYFAIRKCSKPGGMLMIDDVAFTAASLLPDGLELMGYDVWRDGQKINTSLITSATYNDADITPSTTYNYQVTGVYNKGISSPTPQLSFAYTGSGIEALTIEGNIIPGKGNIQIEGFDQMPLAIYSYDGRVIVERENAIAGTYWLQAGLYMVKIGNKAYKIMVK